MKRVMLMTRTFLIGCCVAMLFIGEVQAQKKDEAANNEVVVDVETNFVPKSAIGIIASATTVKQINETTIQKIDSKIYRISFHYDPKEVSKDMTAFAMVILQNDEVVFSPTIPFLSDKKGVTTNKPLPLCQMQEKEYLKIQGQEGSFQSLVVIRKKRRAALKKMLELRLTPELLEHLDKIETGLGLDRSQSINADLPPLELLERLNRIKFAVANYKKAN